MPNSFQEVIFKLNEYWSACGCAILQPYDLEVGAGTFHPATTLKALVKKHWNAAYVQPSRRPTDGRYGENPNRLQHFYQYQGILKPSPNNNQDLYIMQKIINQRQQYALRMNENDVMRMESIFQTYLSL